jgi:leucyl-tRNA synthetase
MSVIQDSKEPQSFVRRNHLLDIEREVQAKWAQARVYEQDAQSDSKRERFVATFPYPYMNGWI